jgi:hypothetical protein
LIGEWSCNCGDSQVHGYCSDVAVREGEFPSDDLRCMNEEEIEARFEEIRNELKAYQEQLDSFKEDLKILFKHRSIAPRDILETAKQDGNAAFDQSDVHRCREFLKKYDLRKGI